MVYVLIIKLTSASYRLALLQHFPYFILFCESMKIFMKYKCIILQKKIQKYMLYCEINSKIERGKTKPNKAARYINYLPLR